MPSIVNRLNCWLFLLFICFICKPLFAQEDSLIVKMNSVLFEPIKIEIRDFNKPTKILKKIDFGISNIPRKLLIKVNASGIIEKEAKSPNCWREDSLCEKIIVDPLIVSFELVGDYLNKVGDILNYTISGIGNIEFILKDSVFFRQLENISYKYTIGRGTTYKPYDGLLEYSLKEKIVSSIIINFNYNNLSDQPEPYRLAYAAGSNSTLRVRIKMPYRGFHTSLFDFPYDHYDLEDVELDQHPIASFIYNPPVPVIDEMIKFDASDSYDPNGSIEQYVWDFGDGKSVKGKRVSHAFSKEGEYLVKLTVIDNDGLSNTEEKKVKVEFVLVSFLDAEDPTREVVGASADGESKVIIQIKGAPNILNEDNVFIALILGDGDLEDKKECVNGIFKQIYTSPNDYDFFKLHTEDEYFREIDLNIELFQNNSKIKIEHNPFYVYKPPVVLIHGLFSDGLMWKNGFQDHLSQNYSPISYTIDYDNATYFSNNLNTIKTRIDNSIEKAKLHNIEKQIVVKKTDIVAHSMGGVLTNLYIVSDIYNNDVNRLLTIDTPHSGSNFANFVLNFTFKENIAIESIITGLTKFLDMSLIDGGVFDLQIGSDANLNIIKSLNNGSTPNIPSAAIQGHGGKKSGLLNLPSAPIIGLFGLFFDLDSKMLNGKYFKKYYPTPIPIYYPGIVEQAIFGIENPSETNSDYIVGLKSQEGGCKSSIEIGIIDHINCGNDEDIQKEVVHLLNSPKYFFDDNGFAPEIIKPTFDPVKESDIKNKLNLMSSKSSGYSVNHEKIRIITPDNGALFSSIDSIFVEVISDNNEAILISYKQVLFDSIPPINFNINIKKDYLGTLNLMALTIDENQNIYIDTISVNVIVDKSIIELITIPAETIYLKTGDKIKLKVLAKYEDLIIRDITDLPETHISALDPSVVIINKNSTIEAKSAGQTMVLLENSGIYQEIKVVVKPLITNVKNLQTKIPNDFILDQNYPNPFNASTTIRFGIPQNSSNSKNVFLSIYDIQGRLVCKLVDKELPSGFYNIIWDGISDDGSHVSSGIYIYSLSTDEFVNSKKLLYLK